MASLTASQLADVVATTLRDLGKPNYTEIATDLQVYTFTSDFLLKDGMKEQVDSGYGLQWDVMYQDAGGAANMGLNDIDNVNIRDMFTQAQADWRYTSTNWGLLQQEVSMNSGASRIVDLIKARRAGAMIAKAKLMEANWWGPPVAVSDTITPWGVNTWLVKNATEGFNGGAPSGYTTIGLNPTTYPNWKHWTAQYTDPTPGDLIRKWIKASRFSEFIPPVSHPDTNTGNKFAYYTNNGVIQPLEELLRSQNDNLGDDVAMYMNKLHFRGAPVMWVPYLEGDTTNPVYGINKGVFKLKYLKGWWDRETDEPQYPGQHNMAAYFIDSMYQFVNENRRLGNFVIATGTTYPS
jgi:hypothetical protein